MSEQNAEVIRRYLRTFITRDLGELRAVVSQDVEAYGGNQHVRGRHNVEAAVLTPGLTVVDQRIVELFARGDRVTVYGVNSYRQDSMYPVPGGRGADRLLLG